MKKLITILTILVLIILIYPIIKVRTEDKEYQIKMHLYKYEEFSNSISNYLRILPPNYIDKYGLVLKADSSDYQIYRHDDMILGIPRHSYIVYYKDQQKIVDLMSHNLVIEALNSGLAKENEVYKYYDLLINKTEFNKIFKTYNRHEKMVIYCELMRTSFDTTTFSLIEKVSDIENVLIKRPKSEGNIIEFELSPENLDNSSLLSTYEFLDNYKPTKEIYYWYFDHGIEHFEFDFNAKDEITFIKNRFVGYLGNEIMHL